MAALPVDPANVLTPHPEAPRNRVYFKSAAEVAVRALEEESRIATGMARPLTWGIPEVDDVVRTMWAGNLTYVVGRPSNGKSMALLHLARRECQRLAAEQEAERAAGVEHGPACRQYVAFTCLEDKESSKLAQLTGAPATLAQLMNGQYDRDAYRRHMLYAAKGWPVWFHGYDQADITAGIVEDLPNLTIEQAYREIRQAEIDHGLVPSAWFVDYLQLAASDIEQRSESEERLRIANVSRQLKRMARTLNIPVVCAAQAKQAVDLRPVLMPAASDIEGSNSPQRDADIILTVWMPRQYSADRWADGLDVGGVSYPGHLISPGFTVLSLVKQRDYIGFGRWALNADLEAKTYRSMRMFAIGDDS